MTKKEFNERISVHNYGGRREGSIIAIFFDWLMSERNGGGFKYCIYARRECATQKELTELLYDIVFNGRENTPYYVQIARAETDMQRFKVPLCSSGLRGLTLKCLVNVN